MKLIIISILFISQNLFSQNFETQDIQINDIIEGTLYKPKNIKNPKLAIIVAGSGLTDKDGNAKAQGLNTNMYKLLAEALVNDMAVFTYDKRTLGLIKNGKINETILTFDEFVWDVDDIVSYFRKQNYNHITLIGHSEGSLLSILSAQKDADALISLAGAGRPIDEILFDQLMKQIPNLQEDILNILGTLKDGKEIEVENPFLKGLFGKHNQPYLINWMTYDPQKELAKIKKPTLIIGSLKDIQVTEFEAYLLSYGKEDAKLEILPNMTHALKNIEKDEDQMKTYSDITWPIAEDLVFKVKTFIMALKK